MSPVGGARLICAIMNDLLKLIGTDCRWLSFFFFINFHCEISKRFFWITYQTTGVSSSRVNGVQWEHLEKKSTRSHAWCLRFCLKGWVGEENTEVHAETTVVSCQPSSFVEGGKQNLSCKRKDEFCRALLASQTKSGSVGFYLLFPLQNVILSDWGDTTVCQSRLF